MNKYILRLLRSHLPVNQLDSVFVMQRYSSFAVRKDNMICYSLVSIIAQQIMKLFQIKYLVVFF